MRIDIFDAGEKEAGIGKDCPYFILNGYIACINQGNGHIQACQFAGIVQDDLALAVIYPSRQQDNIGRNLLGFFQVQSGNWTGGYLMKDGAGSQGGFPGSPSGHVIDQAVDCHLEAAGSAAAGIDMLPFQILDP